MLRLCFDHRSGRLADALLDSFADLGPLDERVVLVPSAGVGRWLQQRDARRHGVTARLRAEFAGRWLWQAMSAILGGLPASSPFEAERVRWHLLALLDEFPADGDFALPAQRMGEPGSVARFALADTVARCFERYLAYRRDGLARWQRGGWLHGDQPGGPHEVWQRWLWNRLLERLSGLQIEHPYDAFQRLLDDSAPGRIAAALDAAAPGARRVAVFGRVDLSPGQFALFGHLARHIDVSFFAPDPCRELWSDLLDPASLARIRAQRPDVAWLYEGEPSILGSWGRVHRDFIAQLHDLEERAGIQAEAPGRDEPWPFAPSPDARAQARPANALQALQAAVFRRSDEVWSDLRADDRYRPQEDASIRVLGAWGIVREAELLHEALLECFATMPGLGPEDIVVHCADLDRVAATIADVFASVPPARRIPVRVSGLARSADDVWLALQQLLDVAVSGIDLPRLQQLLHNRALLAAAGLDEERARGLFDALGRAGAHCGLDASDGAPGHDLRSAVDRLLLGASAGADAVCVDLFAVPGLQGSGIGALDGLLRLMDACGELRALARSARTAPAWCAALGGVVETLFASVRACAASVQRVRDALQRITVLGSVAPRAVLDPAGFARVLADALQQTVPAAVPSGAVTIVPMGSLRGVPYRVVCLFGFDEGAFPRHAPRDELDLMRLAPRFGDRLARNDDQGAFLDALLGARERLLISCCSRDARDGSARNPSPLVAELLRYLAARLRPAGAADGELSAPGSLLRQSRDVAPLPWALIEQPLHPFSRAGFEGAAADRAVEWLETARVAVTPLIARVNEIGALAAVDSRTVRPDSVPARLSGDDGCAGQAGPAPGDSLPVEYLSGALSDPAGTWLREALGLPRALYRLDGGDGEFPPSEPLWPQDKVDPRDLSSWLQRLLAGEDAAALSRRLAAAPYLIAGAGARMQAQMILERAGASVARALGDAGLLVTDGDAAPVVIRVGDLRLRMQPPARDTRGRLLFVSAWSWSMFALVDAWLRTALWRFAVDRSATGRLVFATDDEPVVFHCPDPLHSLTHAITWSQRIVARPLPLFPRSWLAYARERLKGDGAAREMDAVRKGVSRLLGEDNDQAHAEIERPEMRALYRDARPDFAIVRPLCETVYRPVFDDSSLTGKAS